MSKSQHLTTKQIADLIVKQIKEAHAESPSLGQFLDSRYVEVSADGSLMIFSIEAELGSFIYRSAISFDRCYLVRDGYSFGTEFSEPGVEIFAPDRHLREPSLTNPQVNMLHMFHKSLSAASELTNLLCMVEDGKI